MICRSSARAAVMSAGSSGCAPRRSTWCAPAAIEHTTHARRTHVGFGMMCFVALAGAEPAVNAACRSRGRDRGGDERRQRDREIEGEEKRKKTARTTPRRARRHADPRVGRVAAGGRDEEAAAVPRVEEAWREGVRGWHIWVSVHRLAAHDCGDRTPTTGRPTGMCHQNHNINNSNKAARVTTGRCSR